MDRLTWGHICGGYYVDGYAIAESDMEGHVIYTGDALERLAAYEDTGLTPDEVAEYAVAKADGQVVVLPKNWLDTLKLLTITAMCYQDWHSKIMARMGDSKDIQELFFELPTVQYTTNHIRLSRLANSGIDVNELTDIEAVVDVMYPREAAEAALKEGGT